MEQRWLIPQRPNLSIPSIFEARRVLLDALFALAPQEDAIIVVGAQAVYLRPGMLTLLSLPLPVTVILLSILLFFAMIQRLKMRFEAPIFSLSKIQRAALNLAPG